MRYLVDVLMRQAKEKEPETGRLAEESEALSRRVFGESSPCYAAALSNLGTYSLRMDKYDQATVQWMRGLYEGRGEGLTTAEAVQRESLATLRERAKGRSTHPFYWGAFVAAGDWR